MYYVHILLIHTDDTYFYDTIQLQGIHTYSNIGKQRALNKGHPTKIPVWNQTAFCSFIINPEGNLRPQTSSGCRAYSQVIIDYYLYSRRGGTERKLYGYGLFVWHHPLILLSVSSRNSIVYHLRSKSAKKTFYRCRRLSEITWRASIMSKGPSSTPSIYFEMPSP